MSYEDLAHEAGIVGGQGRTDGEVYANGSAALWTFFLIAAAAVLAWVIFQG